MIRGKTQIIASQVLAFVMATWIITNLVIDNLTSLVLSLAGAIKK